jgi:hypothetical protein
MAEGDETNFDNSNLGLDEAGVGPSGGEGSGQSVPGSAEGKLGESLEGEAQEIAENSPRPGDWNPGEQSGGGGELY